MIINWPLLFAGIILFGIAYIRMRDKISIENRSKIEITIMFLTIICLLTSIGLQIIERKDMTENVNDCIRYYRYYSILNDTDFYFIQNCYDILDPLTMQQIKDGGIAWKNQQADLGFVYYQNRTWEIEE